jgi:hypothetical protein
VRPRSRGGGEIVRGTREAGLDLEELQQQREAQPRRACPINAEVARRIACDAQVIPVVLGARGEPLDVGRASRTIPPAIRRAVIVRHVHAAVLRHARGRRVSTMSLCLPS